MRKTGVGIILGLLVLALMVLTTGCSVLSGGKWAAKVNGESILIKDYDARVAEAKKVYENWYIFDNSDQGKQNTAGLKQQIMSNLVQTKLVAQEVKKQNLNVESDAVKARIAEVMDNLTAEQFQEELKRQGITETDFKKLFALLEKISENVEPVSEEDARAFFTTNSMMYEEEPETVSARHILLDTKEEAEEVIRQLKAGADFGELAREKSIEPAAQTSGGNLGTFQRGDMVPEFEEAAFTQKVGEVSAEPVESRFGFHVIIVDSHKQAIPGNFEKIKERVMEDVLSNRKDDLAQAFFMNLYEKAKIEYAKGYQPAGY